MTHATAHIGVDKYSTQIDLGVHSLVADEPPSRGGSDAGPAPYDLLLASLGACTAITLRMYADRKEWPLESLEVQLRLHGQGETLRIERTLAPRGLVAEQNVRLAEIAERTPVTLTLKHGLPIETKLL